MPSFITFANHPPQTAVLTHAAANPQYFPPVWKKSHSGGILQVFSQTFRKNDAVKLHTQPARSHSEHSFLLLWLPVYPPNSPSHTICV